MQKRNTNLLIEANWKNFRLLRNLKGGRIWNDVVRALKNVIANLDHYTQNSYPSKLKEK